MPEMIIIETHGPVGLIRLNRPTALNALCDQLMTELGDQLLAFDADPAIGAIVLTGSERAFAAGADIKEMRDRSYPAVYADDFIGKRWETVLQVKKPVVAAVAGFALGGGCEVTLACDLRIAADNATFGQPEIQLGIIPGGGGTQRLTRLVGPARAKRIVMSGAPVKAAEALAIGLVDEVVPSAELHERAFALAAEYARGAVLAQGLAKRAIMDGLDGSLTDGLELEQELFVEVFRSEDARIGVASFLEHGPGKATFTGR
jgi:enoyl-CoA hydratase